MGPRALRPRPLTRGCIRYPATGSARGPLSVAWDAPAQHHVAALLRLDEVCAWEAVRDESGWTLAARRADRRLDRDPSTGVIVMWRALGQHGLPPLLVHPQRSP